ncbi:sensor histidine kinase [Butyrivibrio sp. NC3005]|uniref:sensor histidine kinase n=1 Tax=Butyrivibrio sp. NC3005 TaxID=1280685 RepID=UPI0006851052|nr:HAMP domain-containing sensor histidine kinase [Butyrivibrio sp. NC3005]
MDFKTNVSNTFHRLKVVNVFRSLRARIFVLVFLTGLISCLVVHQVILYNYETRAVDVRKNEVQTQMRILADHLITYGYLQDTTSEVVNAELDLLANLYDGRVMIIDDDLRIVKDTYGISEDKVIISEEVVNCLKNGNSGITSVYDAQNHYIEITTPIVETISSDNGDEEYVRGVILISVSTEYITTTLDILSQKATRIELIIIIVMFVFSLLSANILLRPFDRITSAINDIKAGYTMEEISVPDYLETEHIVNAFNQLLQRMKTLDDSRQEFVSNVSHELKTPITSMKVLADTLLQQPDAPVDMYKDFMQDISHEVDREAQIINDLLSLVKMDKTAASLNISSVDINDMIELILKRLRPIARKQNIELTYDSRRAITAEVDEVKLSLAIMNLVENAIKYNKDSGWVKVILDADHQSFIVTVSDSGIGIPEDSLNLVFNRFYRVDKSRSREIGGTGLGLSITQSVILMHRGTIDVSSVLDEGTTFIVKIPLSFTK